jgi:hypothetical protein
MSKISELTTDEFLQYLRAYRPISDSTVETKIEVEAAEPVKRLSATSSNFNRNNFLLALEKLINNGFYAKLVSIHTQPEYNIHSTDGSHPNQRFLPWHRVFLRIFEMELNKVTGNSMNITIPYWDWETESRIPDWILNYKVPEIKGVIRYDDGVPHTQDITVERFPGVNADPMPTKADVDRAIGKDTFEDFSHQVELGFHGRVHNYVGGFPLGRESGTMAQFISPADPIFWLHHSNIDRIWHRWQVVPDTDHLDQHPNLPKDGTGQKSPKMSPWPFDENETRKIEEGPLLGYSFDDVN